MKFKFNFCIIPKALKRLSLYLYIYIYYISGKLSKKNISQLITNSLFYSRTQDVYYTI